MSVGPAMYDILSSIYYHMIIICVIVYYPRFIHYQCIVIGSLLDYHLLLCITLYLLSVIIVYVRGARHERGAGVHGDLV